MSKLVLIGGGGHCKSVLDSAIRMHSFEEIVITDPEIERGSRILGCEVVGTDDVLPQLRGQGYDKAFVSVGSIETNSLKKALSTMVENLGFTVPTICDPSSIIADSVYVGQGTFVGKNVVVNAGSVIGKNCIINTGSIIEHECQIGDYTHISVGTVICGGVHIGDDCMVGAGSTIIQSLKIGNNTIIGANSTVLGNIEDNKKKYGIIK